MDQATMDVVKEVVGDMARAGKLFSAFDVTRTVRNEKGLQVFHSEVRRAVHNMNRNMELPMDYTSSDFVLSNGKTAIIYHPQSADVSQYDENTIGAKVSPFSPAQSTAAVQPQTLAPTPTKTTNRDSRGRFCISNKLTKQVGLLAADSVFAYADGSKVVVVKYGNAGVFPAGTEFHELIVDKDINIRLSPGILKEAGLDSGSLKTKIVNDKIEVSVK